MRTAIQGKILSTLTKASKSGATLQEIKISCRAKRPVEFNNCINHLVESGHIVNVQNKFFLPSELGLYQAKIVRNCQKFCFAKRLQDDEQIFIPGRFSKGAIVEDLVLISPLKKIGQAQVGQSEEGMVHSIYKKGDYHFTGVLVKEDGRFFLQPDSLSRDLMAVKQQSVGLAQAGDKVIAHVCMRGDRHSRHLCEILTSCGSAEKASVCAQAILESSGAETEFAPTVFKNAQRISQREISNAARAVRLDLTDKQIFTIDSAESKDLDDAVSIEKTDSCYQVGVHIADVAHYIKFRSPLDVEAYHRGTSIYYANHVVPMLPPPLSNGICSLNEGVERLAFSALINVGFDGEIIDFKFRKTIIKSKVKGVYKEINQILDKTASDEMMDKYSEVMPSIHLMHELFEILHKNKIDRGSPQIHTTESKIIVDENEFTVDIVPRVQGVSESMIEEFMLLANEAAATLGEKANLPFVYRVHEIPSEEKVSGLKQMMDRLGIPSAGIQPKMKPKVLANLLEKTRDTELFPIVNMQVLRSMSKARYDVKPVGHYGLSLQNYAHFTSPIRRYSDLMVHRILTDYVSHKDQPEILQKRYGKFVSGASSRATETEKRAMMIERSSSDCYKAEYMKSHIGEEFDGIITSIIARGMFVALPNTVEGYIKIETLTGDYEYDGFAKLVNHQTGHSYRIGEKIRVVCSAADVNAGNVDFSIE